MEGVENSNCRLLFSYGNLGVVGRIAVYVLHDANVDIPHGLPVFLKGFPASTQPESRGRSRSPQKPECSPCCSFSEGVGTAEAASWSFKTRVRTGLSLFGDVLVSCHILIRSRFAARVVARDVAHVKLAADLNHRFGTVSPNALIRSAAVVCDVGLVVQRVHLRTKLASLNTFRDQGTHGVPVLRPQEIEVIGGAKSVLVQRMNTPDDHVADSGEREEQRHEKTVTEGVHRPSIISALRQPRGVWGDSEMSTDEAMSLDEVVDGGPEEGRRLIAHHPGAPCDLQSPLFHQSELRLLTK